jgi:predicted permease
MSHSVELVAFTTRSAIRGLRRTPLISTVAILTLAIGAGLVGTVIGLIDSLNSAPLPYANASRTAALTLTIRHRALAFSEMPMDVARRVASASRSFDATSIWTEARMIVEYDGAPAQRMVGQIDSSFGALFDVRPIAGRWFEPTEVARGAPVVVVSAEYVRTERLTPTSIIGKTVAFGEAKFVVIGVVDGGRLLPDRAAAWIPLFASPQSATPATVHMLARRAPGLSPQAAMNELGEMSRRLADIDTRYAGETIVMRQEMIDRSLRVRAGVSGLLTSIAAAVLLIAAFNISALLMLRSSQQQRDVAICLMLGASKSRLMLEHLLEALFLASCAGVIGILLSHWVLRIVAANIPPAVLPTWVELDVSPRVLLLVIVSLIATAAGVSALPVRLSLKTSLLAVANAGGQAVTHSGRIVWMARRILISQVAAAVVLSTGAVLVVTSYARLSKVDFGYPADSISVVDFRFDGTPYSNPSERSAMALSLASSLQAGTRDDVAVRGPFRETLLSTDDKNDAPDPNPTQIANRSPGGLTANRLYPRPRIFVVSSDYRRLLNLSLLSGRWFDRQDWRGSEPVAVVSARFAREVFARWPIGQSIEIGTHAHRFVIIGVVADVRDLQTGARGISASPRADVYLSTAQAVTEAPQLLARTSLTPGALQQNALEHLKRERFAVPIERPRTMLEVYDGDFRAVRLTGTLFAAFAIAALALSAIGVYSVVRFSVQQKQREIGIRSALGSTPEALTAQLLYQELRFVVAGLIVGAGVALFLPRLLSPLVFGFVSGTGVTIPFVVVTLLTAAALGCYPHAKRAAFAPPSQVLRAS